VTLPLLSKLSTPSLGITFLERHPEYAEGISFFQLPLSGYLPRGLGRQVDAYVFLSTPSLGITITTPLEGLRPDIRETFNSLSRDHDHMTTTPPV
jgi:hypothetical protein